MPVNEKARAAELIQEVRKLVGGQSGDVARLRQLADDLRQLAAGLQAAGTHGGGPAAGESGTPPDVVDAEYERTPKGRVA